MRAYYAYCFIAITWVAALQQLYAQSSPTVVLSDRDYSFSISIPPNWKLDTTKRALQAAAKAVLYTTSLGKSECRIGVLIATKKVEGKKTLSNLLAFSAQADSISKCKAHIEDPTVFTKDKKKAIVVHSIFPNTETAAAYIEVVNIVLVLAQWDMGEVDHQKGTDALLQVVRSYSSEPIEGAGKK